MASISSRRFTVDSDDDSGRITRAARRVIFNADFLKSAKLCTGDIVAFSKEDNTSIRKDFAVGIVWPSLEISQDSVLITTSLRLTAQVEVGDKVQIFPLSGITATKPPPGVPSLRYLEEAGTIRLKEILGSSPPVAGHTSENKQRDWLSLLLRESLVALKYITCAQIVEVLYEGRKRRFSVTAVSTQRPEPEGHTDELAHDLESLSIASQTKLWAVGWDSVVLISGIVTHQQKPLQQPNKVEILTPSSLNDAYLTVGGLNKQIQQIRDLLEIPLTRPELFRYFGLKPPRGILLHGPPGTGKTHLARAIASSTQSSVLVINGPELSSAYHGETESKLRDVFREAREKSPCIVVLDEVDALVPRREDSAGGEVEKRVVATLLTILDGMEEGTDGEGRVVVIGTTNRPNAIDPALRRPGRFDREIEIGE